MCYQDFKERKIYLWLFFTSFLLIGYLHFNNVHLIQFFTAIGINIVITVLILTVLFIYSKFTLKKEFKKTFGMGDLFFFIIIAIGFPTATFLVLFSFSLFFSLLIYSFFKNRMKQKTVPLAGLQSLFISSVFSINWIMKLVNLYTI